MILRGTEENESSVDKVPMFGGVILDLEKSYFFFSEF